VQVSARTREELAPALRAVQSEIVEVRASMVEDQFDHQTTFTRLSQEVLARSWLLTLNLIPGSLNSKP
jgi:hypothetical protein